MPRLVDFLEMITTNAYAWNDLNFEGVSFGTGASAPDIVDAFGSGGIRLRAFDGNVTLEQLYSGGEMLHDYREGTDINFHIHWLPTTTNSGNVEWNIEYVWQNVEDSLNTILSLSTISTIQATTGVAWTAYVKGFDAVSGTGKKIGSHISFRLYRNPASSNDTYPDDAGLLSVGIHYEVDTLGSRDIFIK